jgi:hypothetical protein
MNLKQLIHTFSLTLILSQSALGASLINVDFGADVRFPSHNKTGFAATGITANDYWNFYSADNPDGSWKVNGNLANLKDAGGVITSAGLAVLNGDGAWSYGSSDPMLYNYIYGLSAETRITVMNLSAGTYNFYLYGPDSTFNLKVGSTDYGTKVCLDIPVVNPPSWTEGKQYVLFSNVNVGVSDTPVINLGLGAVGYNGVIGGMQIELVPEPSCILLAGFGGLFLAYRVRKLR